MNIRLANIVLLCMVCMQAKAQTFPEEKDGSPVYYRIMSAAADYAGQERCLEDISNEKRSFSYAVKPYAADVQQQEWTLITQGADSEKYHLRNRSNNRYISTSVVVADGFQTLAFSSKKQTNDALKFTPIGDGQYTISYTDDSGDCYFAATDLNYQATTMPRKLTNTIWAWRIYTSQELQDGILDPCQLMPRIGIQDRHIVVIGAAEWQVLDTQGRVTQADAALQPGIYIVVTGKQTKKVLVR